MVSGWHLTAAYFQYVIIGISNENKLGVKGGKKEAKLFSFWISDLLDFLKVRAISSTSGPKAKGIVSSTKEVF